MTETYSTDTPADDIRDIDDAPTSRLDRQADRLLSEPQTRSFAPTTSLRRSVRDDLGAGRTWARGRVEAARDGIVEEPVKATLYALGLGVLIGLLISR